MGASSTSDTKLALVMSGKITYARSHLAGWQAPVGVQLLRLGVLARAIGARLTGRGQKWRTGWVRRADWWNGFSQSR